MFEFQLEIGKCWQRKFRNLWMRSGDLGKFKAWEVQVYRSWGIFNIELDLNISGRDHAGPRFGIGILGYCFTVSIYDVRHWDRENNQFINDYRNT